MPDKSLEGRVALISGASRGLGKAMAVALASSGATLALVARDLEKLNETAAECRSAGVRAEVFQTDVTDEAAVEQLSHAVLDKLGAVHILINNAGTNVRKNVQDFTLAEWNSVLHTNLTSAFLLSRAFVPPMKTLGWGRILNMASMMGHISIAGRTAYSATKAGLLGFTKSLALELAADGITVVALSPGPFATEMNLPLLNDAEKNAQFISRIPVGRWGRPEEIGQLAAFLCSDAAAFITGTDILIDGGWCAQ